MARNNKTTGRKGFTLIELLVVIAIIAILAAILFPVFAKARDKARTTACLNNIKEIALAIQMYLGDWDGFYPMATGNHSIVPGPPPTVGTGLMPYVENNYAMWRCPNDNTARPVGLHACTYGFYPTEFWGVYGVLRRGLYGWIANTGVVDESKNLDALHAPANIVAFTDVEDPAGGGGFGIVNRPHAATVEQPAIDLIGCTEFGYWDGSVWGNCPDGHVKGVSYELGCTDPISGGYCNTLGNMYTFWWDGP